MNKKVRNICAVILLLAASLVYRFEVLESCFGLSSSSAQFALVPVVFLFMVLFRFADIVISKSAIGVAALATAGLGAAAFRSQVPVELSTTGSVKFYLSPFVGDSRESQTIKFDDLFKKSLDQQDVPLDLERVPNPLVSGEEIGLFLADKTREEELEIPLVLAGSPRWINLGVSPRFSDLMMSEQLKKVGSHLGLQLATRVSGTGLSGGFDIATQEYLSLLASGFVALGQGNRELAERNIADAASVVGLWTGTAHRSYALWLLGTLYLNEAFRGETIEPAYLLCAIDYLTRARRFIRNNENPELLGAILNNRAVAHFYAYLFSGHKEMRIMALRELKVAIEMKFKESTNSNYPAWAIAKMNLVALEKPIDPRKIFTKRRKMLAKKKRLEALRIKKIATLTPPASQ